MSGIIFMGTGEMEKVKDFYLSRVGMKLWLEQADCIVLEHGNLLLGFCAREQVETSGIITFFLGGREWVHQMYDKLKDTALAPPEPNEKYRIYNFFATDPEGRKVEFQSFDHPVEPHLRCDEALTTRRSVRRFKDEPVPDELLWKVVEDCRFSPTSMNTESFYFVVIRDREKIEYLASLRGKNSRPIAKGPLAVALCADPDKTKRPEQDGCIAATHFILAAHTRGLGTCWIAAMDRDDAKEALDIPQHHYLVTVTPLGFPAESPEPHPRREAEEIVRFVE